MNGRVMVGCPCAGCYGRLVRHCDNADPVTRSHTCDLVKCATCACFGAIDGSKWTHSVKGCQA